MCFYFVISYYLFFVTRLLDNEIKIYNAVFSPCNKTYVKGILYTCINSVYYIDRSIIERAEYYARDRWKIRDLKCQYKIKINLYIYINCQWPKSSCVDFQVAFLIINDRWEKLYYSGTQQGWNVDQLLYRYIETHLPPALWRITIIIVPVGQKIYHKTSRIIKERPKWWYVYTSYIHYGILNGHKVCLAHEEHQYSIVVCAEEPSPAHLLTSRLYLSNHQSKALSLSLHTNIYNERHPFISFPFFFFLGRFLFECRSKNLSHRARLFFFYMCIMGEAIVPFGTSLGFALLLLLSFSKKPCQPPASFTWTRAALLWLYTLPPVRAAATHW